MCCKDVISKAFQFFSILESLDIKIMNKEEDSYKVSVPPYRVDIVQEADVVEEILRIYGFNNIELTAHAQTEYLAEFPEKDFDTLETKFGGVWAPYYTYQKIMQGLLDAYVRTGNKRAYDMVVNMASYVEKRMAKLN